MNAKTLLVVTCVSGWFVVACDPSSPRDIQVQDAGLLDVPNEVHADAPTEAQAEAFVEPDSDTVEDASDGFAVDGAGECSAPWTLEFQAAFDDLEGPPWVDGYTGLPLSLFPEDGSGWTQLQNSHPGLNTAAIVSQAGSDKLIECSATGQPDGVASKMDLGKGGFSFKRSAIIRLSARFKHISSPVSPTLTSNTLMDLEDNDNLFIDGQNLGAGLRVAVDANGRLMLDRGEVPGSEDEVSAPVARLSNLKSDFVFPSDVWVHLVVDLKLGVDTARSTVGPIDDTFDAASTDAWVSITAAVGDMPSALVLNMKGTNLLSLEALEAVLAQLRPDSTASLVGEVDYDNFQVGATNNRSTADVTLQVDDVSVERRLCKP